MINSHYNIYISDKGLVEECDEEENLATSGAASASCWRGRLCNILFKFAVTGISGSNPERVPGHRFLWL